MKDKPIFKLPDGGIDNPKIEQPVFLDQALGKIKVVSAAPDWTPRGPNFLEYFAIYRNNDETPPKRLYWYDGNDWNYATGT